MKFKIKISKWTNPYFVRYLWSEKEYTQVGPGQGPSALLSIYVRDRKDGYFKQKVTVYKHHLGVAAIFLGIVFVALIARLLDMSDDIFAPLIFLVLTVLGYIGCVKESYEHGKYIFKIGIFLSVLFLIMVIIFG
jgi:hypothetical protein